MSAMIGTSGKTKAIEPVAAATDGVLGTMTLSHTLRPGDGAAAWEAILSAGGERLSHDAVALRGMLGTDGKFASATEPLERLQWLQGATRTPEDLLGVANTLAQQSDSSIATFATDLSGFGASHFSPGAIPGVRRGAHNYLQDAATAVERRGTFDPNTGARVSQRKLAAGRRRLNTLERAVVELVAEQPQQLHDHHSHQDSFLRYL